MHRDIRVISGEEREIEAELGNQGEDTESTGEDREIEAELV